MHPVARDVTHRYVDPLAQIWLEAARRIGLRIVRTPDAYAATDGSGTLAIGTDATLDPDDSLAQMIFHELCHSLVEGEAAFARPDWGMDNTGPDHDWREHACLRVQWILAGRHGLRGLFAPTTDFRAFWDRLDGDVLADRPTLSVQAAIAALHRVARPPWAPALTDALAATAEIAQVTARFTQVGTTGATSAGPSTADPSAAGPSTAGPSTAGPSTAGPSTAGPSAAGASTAGPSAAGPSAAGPSTAGMPAAGPSAATAKPSLWRAVVPPPAPHPTGLPAGPAAASCGDCAWRTGARCRQAAARVDPSWPACERFESALDCQTCGACCRAAYHSVEVSRRDPVVKAQPDFIVDRGSYLEIRRNGDRCAALEGGRIEHGTTTRYHCTIYGDRPRTCRDFTLGSAHCLTARRRVGLSL
jgi:hypothetical protein